MKRDSLRSFSPEVRGLASEKWYPPSRSKLRSSAEFHRLHWREPILNSSCSVGYFYKIGLPGRQLRLLLWPVCFLLAACSSHPEDRPTVLINPPDLLKVTAALRTVAAEAKLGEPWEISAPIEANPISAIPWIICLIPNPTYQNLCAH